MIFFVFDIHNQRHALHMDFFVIKCLYIFYIKFFFILLQTALENFTTYLSIILFQF